MKTPVSILILSIALMACSSSAQSTLRQYLSGTGKDNTVTWDFYCTGGRNSGFWTTIPVPSNWELKGFGNYAYQNEPTQPEQGLYRYVFTVPKSWLGKTIDIVFDGVMTDADVSINGTSVGFKHQGGFYRFHYEISKLLRYDSLNSLAVTVSRTSSDTSVNTAERHGDYWNFSGIYRPVYLQAYPVRHIERIALNAEASGAFTADVVLDSITSSALLKARILSPNGTEVANQSVALIPQQASTQILATVSSPLLWTAEKPNRYTLELSLKSGDTLLHIIKQQFGFRSIEVKSGNGVYINGQKIKFKGVNRHCFWPAEGRTLNRSLSLADVLLIKEMNMNAVRMSHYPPDDHFLDMCDSLGLYVLDELGGWQGSYATDVGKKLVKEMVVRDVNHPCIIFWDNGNKGGWNTALDTCFSHWDPQKRPVLHPGATFSGINTQHYGAFTTVQSALNGSSIYMPTEFLHGLYDSGGGLYDYWKLMYNNPLCAGGFIRALLDETVVRTDRNNILDDHNNQGPEGIVGPYREKEGSYYTIKKAWSPVYIDIDTIPESFHGSIPIENCYDFTDLNQCSFVWKLANADFFSGDTGLTIVKTGSSKSPSIAPHTSGTLNMLLPSDWASYDILLLSASDPYGKIICSWSWMLHNSKQIRSSIIDTASVTAAPVSCTQGSTSFLITAGCMEYVFSKKGGRLTAVRRRGKDISFTTDSMLPVGGVINDTVSVTQKSNFTTITVKSSDTGSIVQWTVYGSGLCRLSYKYTLSGAYDFHGITFNYPESNVRVAQWLGKGPYRVWRNRKQGLTYNIWRKVYNNDPTVTNRIYPEFKGYFADVNWVKLITSEDTINIINDTTGTYLSLYTSLNDSTLLNAGNSFSSGVISLLHAVVPIYNTSADGTEPQGILTSKNRTVSGSCYLYFGNLQKVARIIAQDTFIKAEQQQNILTSPPNASIVLRRSGKAVTYIDFFIPSESMVSITISDILGRKSYTLYKEKTGVGWHTYEFSLSGAGVPLPRGIYILQLVSNGRTLVTRTLGAY